jgi:hypothetical protein
MERLEGHCGPTTPFYPQTLRTIYIRSPSLGQLSTYASTPTCISSDNDTYHGGLIHLNNIAHPQLILSRVATKKCLHVRGAELREIFPAT